MQLHGQGIRQQERGMELSMQLTEKCLEMALQLIKGTCVVVVTAT